MPQPAPSRMRVAVYGGDSRNARVGWPDGFVVEHFESQQYGGDGPLRRLINATKSGGFDVVIVLTSWTGHPANHAIKNLRNTTRVLHWPRGPKELSRQLPTFVRQ